MVVLTCSAHPCESCSFVLGHRLGLGKSTVIGRSGEEERSYSPSIVISTRVLKITHAYVILSGEEHINRQCNSPLHSCYIAVS